MPITRKGHHKMACMWVNRIHHMYAGYDMFRYKFCICPNNIYNLLTATCSSVTDLITFILNHIISSVSYIKCQHQMANFKWFFVEKCISFDECINSPLSRQVILLAVKTVYYVWDNMDWNACKQGCNKPHNRPNRRKNNCR